MDLRQLKVTIPHTGRTVEVWQAGQGPDLVLLHGAGGLDGWNSFLDLLSRSFRVTAPLFPGFGHSDGVETIDDVLDATLHYLDVLKEMRISRPHLLGYSMGGMLAGEMAAIAPGEVGKLALIAPLGLWDDDHPVADIFALTPQEMGKYFFYDKSNPMAKALAATLSADDEKSVEIIVRYLKGLAAAGRILWPIPDRGLIKRNARITAPTLIIWGESDKVAPVFYAKEFGRLIAGSKVRTIKEAGHMVALEQARQTANALAQFFLDGVSRIPGKPERPSLAAVKKAQARAHAKHEATASKAQKPAPTAKSAVKLKASKPVLSKSAVKSKPTAKSKTAAKSKSAPKSKPKSKTASLAKKKPTSARKKSS